MEATMFTGWIYDHLKPQAAVLKVTPDDAAGDCRRKGKEQSHRRQQDLRLLARALPALRRWGA